jgi:methionyl-tRNA formyltransferase
VRLVFAGSPAAALPSLLALAESEHEIAAVLTRSDTPQGRKRVLTPTPVAVEAERLGLPVIKTRRMTDEVTARLQALDADLGVIVAFGALLREPVLSLPRLGWINLHFSLLPRWRGAAPVQRALMAGDGMTGAAVFQLVAELDAGDVYGVIEHPLNGDETAGSLLDELAVSGAVLLSRTVDSLAAGTAVGAAQTGEVSLAPKLTIDDGALDLRRPAREILDRYRGSTPEPGAHVPFDGSRLKVLELAAPAPRRGDGEAEGDGGAPIAPEPGVLVRSGRSVLVGTATGPLELLRVQPAGKRPMSAADWFRGLPDRGAPHLLVSPLSEGDRA